MVGQCWEHWAATKGELPDDQVAASTTEEAQLEIKSCGSQGGAAGSVGPAVVGLSKENVSRQHVGEESSNGVQTAFARASTIAA
ncbi:hypothetical protein DVH05_023120 [Phytophthora capsici]|nr:hypothetical protein DVH05_023120 [Phytophthora capsici]